VHLLLTQCLREFLASVKRRVTFSQVFEFQTSFELLFCSIWVDTCLRRATVPCGEFRNTSFDQSQESGVASPRNQRFWAGTPVSQGSGVACPRNRDERTLISSPSARVRPGGEWLLSETRHSLSPMFRPQQQGPEASEH